MNRTLILVFNILPGVGILSPGGSLYDYISITADYIEEPSIHVNGRHPYYIRCQWKDTLTGQTYQFKSGYIWHNPEPQLQHQQKLDVYINPDKPGKNYYVDTTFLESKVTA
ncbi:MAG TPA: hypothetical protein VM802_29745 [Chitinophaga sp.]|nr:hypothetical protein [Chitinophaga sp.]